MMRDVFSLIWLALIGLFRSHWVDPRSLGCVADDPRAFLAKRHDVGIGWYAGKLLGEVGFYVLPKFGVFERIDLVVEQFAVDDGWISDG